MARKFGMTIGGETAPAPAYREILNPANCEDVVGLAPECTTEHLNAAVEAAAKAFRTWSRTGDAERREACLRVVEVINANAAELSEILTLEQGKPLNGMGAAFEIGGCAAWAGATAELSLPPKVLQKDGRANIEMHRVPLGVVGSITPWNFPLLIACWHIVPAIRTGNTVVIKPSPFTPLGTLRLIELMNEVLPPGVVNAVSGGDDIGAALSQHPGIAKIVFTGSIPTGMKIMQSAAPTMKRLTLELGGNDPGIVLPDADPAAIAEGIFWGAFINSGQTCAALKRLYVHESIHDAVCEALTAYAKQVRMGDGMDPDSQLGPLQNRNQFEKVSAMVDDARRAGAQIRTGGEPMGKGYFYPVTLITGAKDGMRIVDEEQFGPVLPIISYSSVDDVIDRTNGQEFGLSASVWSSDPEAARGVAQRIDAGTVYINKHADISPHVPFGGSKCSGLGVEFGEEGLEAYTNIKIYNAAG